MKKPDAFLMVKIGFGLLVTLVLLQIFYPGINFGTGEIQEFSEATVSLGQSVDLRPETIIVPGYHLIYSGQESRNSSIQYLISIQYSPTGRSITTYRLSLELGDTFDVYKYVLKLDRGNKNEIHITRVS